MPEPLLPRLPGHALKVLVALKCLPQPPQVSREALSEVAGLKPWQVEEGLKGLITVGLIRRQGPDHYEILPPQAPWITTTHAFRGSPPPHTPPPVLSCVLDKTQNQDREQGGNRGSVRGRQGGVEVLWCSGELPSDHTQALRGWLKTPPQEAMATAASFKQALMQFFRGRGLAITAEVTLKTGGTAHLGIRSLGVLIEVNWAGLRAASVDKLQKAGAGLILARPITGITEPPPLPPHIKLFFIGQHKSPGEVYALTARLARRLGVACSPSSAFGRQVQGKLHARLAEGHTEQEFCQVVDWARRRREGGDRFPQMHNLLYLLGITFPAFVACAKTDAGVPSHLIHRRGQELTDFIADLEARAERPLTPPESQ